MHGREPAVAGDEAVGRAVQGRSAGVAKREPAQLHSLQDGVEGGDGR
jgi:hypothetical protein